MAKVSLAAQAAQASEHPVEPMERSAQQALEAVGGMFGAPAEIDDTSNSTAYCTFVSQKSKNWGDLSRQIPGLAEPDVVLIRPKPELPVKLAVFRFHLLSAKQYWAKFDSEGALTHVWLEKPGYDPYIKEVIEAIVLAHVGDTLEPARVSFKSTKCGAARAANAALREATSPAWGEKSSAHKASLAAPQPFLRFTATVTTARRTSKTSGLPYYQADAIITAASPNDWVACAKFFGSPGAAEKVKGIKEAHERRLEEVAAIASRTK